MEYAFLVQPKGSPLRTLQIKNAIQNEKITSVSVSHSTYPWVVVLHTDQPLDEQERAEIQCVLDSLEGDSEEERQPHTG